MLWTKSEYQGRVSIIQRSQTAQAHENIGRFDRGPEIGAAIENSVHSHSKLGESVLSIPLGECLHARERKETEQANSQGHIVRILAWHIWCMHDFQNSPLYTCQDDFIRIFLRSASTALFCTPMASSTPLIPCERCDHRAR